MKREAGRSELANSPQPLKGGRIDQLNQESFSRIAAIEGDRAMEGIMVSPTRAHPQTPQAGSGVLRLLDTEHLRQWQSDRDGSNQMVQPDRAESLGD